MNLSFITSSKPTSSNINRFRYFASIDKLIIDIRDKEFRREDFISNLKLNGFSYEEGYFKNEHNRTNINIKHQNGAISYVRTIGAKGPPCTLIVNPSNFTCATQALDEICKLLPDKNLNNTRLSRVDLSLDMCGSFNDVSNQVDVKFKRISNHATYNGSKIDFISFGKSTSGEYVKVYDKSSHYGLGVPITRLEIQLSFPKVKKIFGVSPFSVFEQLHTKDFHEHRRNPLGNIRFIEIEQLEVDKPCDLKRKHNLEGSINIAPHSIVRRRLNSNGNFLRDHKKVISVIESKYQPRLIYQLGIKEWFEKGYENVSDSN